MARFFSSAPVARTPTAQPDDTRAVMLRHSIAQAVQLCHLNDTQRLETRSVRRASPSQTMGEEGAPLGGVAAQCPNQEPASGCGLNERAE